jgi:hypothetical protein
MLCEHGRGCGFESRDPRHPSSMLYKLALSESVCISGKFVGNLSPTDLEGLPVIQHVRHFSRLRDGAVIREPDCQAWRSLVVGSTISGLNRKFAHSRQPQSELDLGAGLMSRAANS